MEFSGHNLWEFFLVESNIVGRRLDVVFQIKVLHKDNQKVRSMGAITSFTGRMECKNTIFFMSYLTIVTNADLTNEVPGIRLTNIGFYLRHLIRKGMVSKIR